MPSIFSTFVKRTARAKDLFRLKKPIPVANVIRIGAAVLLVMGLVGASRMATRHDSSQTHTAVQTHAAVQETDRPLEPAKPSAVKKADSKTSKTAAPSTTLVTITGCLEQRDETTFRLKDTDGTDVPKARTWKTAFLKRGPAPIEVVDAANRLKLNDHVGQRVTVTGTLNEREMQVRSLQRVAASCEKTPQA